MIITKRHRRSGLPRRRLIVVTLPAHCSMQEAGRLHSNLRNLKNCDSVILPHGYAAVVK